MSSSMSFERKVSSPHQSWEQADPPRAHQIHHHHHHPAGGLGHHALLDQEPTELSVLLSHSRNSCSPPAISTPARPRLATFLLCLLVPTVFVCVALSPLALFFSLFPLTVVIGLPIWLSSTILLVISLAWIPYLLFAQDDLPSQSSLLLPFSPIKVLRIVSTLVKHVIIVLRSNWLEIMLDYSYRKIIVIGRNRRTKPAIVSRDIIYAYSDNSRRRNKRLDVYLPPSFSANTARAPVLVFIHPGGWRWFHKSLFLQLGLRLRRLGFCVVIPDFTKFPEGRCEQSARDIRCALRWVSRSIGEYGGDAHRIFLAGHGSGAHLALLTVLESSVAQCLEEYGYPGDAPPAAGVFSHGNGHISSHELELPHIEGMILLSGIYDPIHQLRAEARVGCHQFLALRRALGPSHAITLQNSPAHLLHWAQNFLLPRHLPPKFLIIHGGEDRNVAILQSHFLSTLLENINRHTGSDDQSSCYSPEDAGSSHGGAPKAELKVRFTPLKHLDHLGTLFSLLIADGPHQRQFGYSKLIVDEILSLVG
ncbi:hypothetical protein PCANC_24858 [Puccinia coronata f. sp. avenae]|uniref:BD-FAE-like domain-containing protein n=1 Tax=Puccinia coronata f. sp. avenae TaxID=200324 RepID=A0A2N5S442_9BASI|nr:hypothetical protein PCANC_24858 [Puccinia coronata f. sp. avenae]